MCSRSPYRLEQSVGEAQHHDVLHRFLAEEMIDPVDLMLLQRLENLGVQRFGRRQIVAEGFFDHDAAPLAVVFRHQARSAETSDRFGKETIRDGEVKEVVARGVGGLLQLRQVFAQPPVGSGSLRSPCT